MSTQNQLDYERIAKAIEYIRSNFKLQPSLDEVAENIHLSPSHFQKMFSDWAGTSPKKFLQFISLEHANRALIRMLATSRDHASPRSERMM